MILGQLRIGARSTTYAALLITIKWSWYKTGDVIDVIKVINMTDVINVINQRK